MFNNIVLTTDLSLNAEAAVPHALELAQRFGGKIHLLSVLEDMLHIVDHSSLQDFHPVRWMVQDHFERTRRLKQTAATLALEHGVAVTPEVRHGHPAMEIIEYAKDIDADAIVIATHGRTGLSHVVYGSVAERVARLSPVPVLSIRPANPIKNKETPMIAFKNIVLATDLSENARAAVPVAIELGRHYDATIHLVNVFEDDLYLGDGGEAWMSTDPVALLSSAREYRESELKELAATLPTTENVRIEPHLLTGHAATAIVQFAKDKNADCIVISTHGRTGLSRLFFGSVAERVVRLSPCPVLTVKPETIVPAKKLELQSAGKASNEDIVL